MTAPVNGDVIYRPRVVVKFYDGVALPYDSSATEQVRRRFDPHGHVFDRFPGIVFKPLFYSKPPDEIRQLVASAQAQDLSYNAPDFLSYFIVDVPPDVDPEVLRSALAGMDGVTLAYVKLPAGDPPAVHPGGNPLSGLQGYLNAAPQGIDARFAWTQAGGDGTGQRLVDVERGWAIEHEDLAAHRIDVFSGRNADFIPHGTAVLGIVAAVDNHVGCVGIAPMTGPIGCASAVRSNGNVDVENAILDAVFLLKAHDPFAIILLEMQYGDPPYPAEIEDPVFNAVRLATALRITVVAAAGNGAHDLDTVEVNGEMVFDRTYRDSGAVFVGAATWEERVRSAKSNYGSRVDCFAWGENVATTSTNDDGSNHRRYTNCASGTSSAAAIVAGAALALQGVAEARYNKRYKPLVLRALLSDAANTTSENPGFDRIGVMPDLRRIICDLMQHP